MVQAIEAKIAVLQQKCATAFVVVFVVVVVAANTNTHNNTQQHTTHQHTPKRLPAVHSASTNTAADTYMTLTRTTHTDDKQLRL